jgi:hypothetical protein
LASCRTRPPIRLASASTAGATLQAVAGAVSIYLLIGLVFAWLIGFVAHVDDAPYFVGGTDGTEGERAYYSLAVLTTTGFGDFTAAQPLGRALAVVEMLVGQLYLVTVIGVPGAAAGGLRCDGGRRGARCGGRVYVTRTS